MFPQSSNDCELNVREQCKNLSLYNEKSKNETYIENKGLRMMQKMGYITGCGLGKHEQGIREPVANPVIIGNRGFGLYLKNIQPSNEDWDFSKEEIIIEQKVSWLENNKKRNFSPKKMKKWITEGPRKTSVDEEYLFCDKDIFSQVNKGKAIFDELDPMELSQARGKANPFETIRSAFFMNRAALKMANIDAATDFMFTNIANDEHHSHHQGPFYFADVCAGPGGFTEYILWRKGWIFKGFGFTLKDENDFRLSDSVCMSPATFQSLYGAQGDGNVCCPENIIDFRDKVLAETDHLGVHFMMSDGGFSVEGKENFQEVLSKNIYICQCLVALEILREHGHFVTKLFDIFTPFSVGLLFLMYHCFEKVAIFKPNSSRPANSERYFICSNLRQKSCIEPIKKHLWNIVNRLWELYKNVDIDVLNIVPVNLITSDEIFNNYIVESNNKLGKRQILGLEKLAAFCRNPSLIDTRQEDLRLQCLHYWNIPDKLKVQKCINNDEQKPMWSPEFVIQPREIYKIESLDITINDLEDWQYCAMYCTRKSNNCYFYAGVGYTKVCRYQRDKWIKVNNFQLSKGTLLYGEFVKERSVKKRNGSLKDESESHKYSLHVIDALSLGEKKLTDLKFLERSELIKIYCKAVNREYYENSIRLRPKVLKSLLSIIAEPIIQRDKINNKLFCNLPTVGYKAVCESFEVNSLLLMKTNENQTFNSTYVLRIQIFLNAKDEDDEDFSMESFVNYIKERS